MVDDLMKVCGIDRLFVLFDENTDLVSNKYKNSFL